MSVLVETVRRTNSTCLLLKGGQCAQLEGTPSNHSSGRVKFIFCRPSWIDEPLTLHFRLDRATFPCIDIDVAGSGPLPSCCAEHRWVMFLIANQEIQPSNLFGCKRIKVTSRSLWPDKQKIQGTAFWPVELQRRPPCVFHSLAYGVP